MKITEEELKNLKFVGKGTYGSVYTDGDRKIKIYHDQIKLSDFGYWYCNNPSLKIRKSKFKRMTSKNKKIEGTDTALEPVYINGKFKGVTGVYINGDVLKEHKDERFSLKRKKSLELIKKVEELNKNGIYPCDLRDNNIVVDSNGNVQLIDLDDIKTYVPYITLPHHKKNSFKSLKSTIFTYMNSNQCRLSYALLKKIDSFPENKDINDIDELRRYVKSLDDNNQIIIIDYYDIPKLDLDKIKAFMEKNDLKLVLSVNEEVIGHNDDELDDRVILIKQKGLRVYDIFLYKDNYETRDFNYLDTHSVSKCYTMDSKGQYTYTQK